MSKEMNEVMVNDMSFSFDLSMLSEGSNNFVCSIPDDGSRTAKGNPHFGKSYKGT